MSHWSEELGGVVQETAKDFCKLQESFKTTCINTCIIWKTTKNNRKKTMKATPEGKA